jgi:hypothetical protein
VEWTFDSRSPREARAARSAFADILRTSGDRSSDFAGAELSSASWLGTSQSMLPARWKYRWTGSVVIRSSRCATIARLSRRRPSFQRMTIKRMTIKSTGAACRS